MRLTDEEIEEYVKNGKGYCSSHELYGKQRGAEFARDFYENQRCEACDSIEICVVRESLFKTGVWGKYSNTMSFGCNQWEPRT